MTEQAAPIAVKGRILEVGDDEYLREIYALICGRRGFEVIQARCGDEAIELYRRHPTFALVLTDYYFYDYLLPEPPLSKTDCLRDGILLALAIRRINPGQKITIHTATAGLSQSMPEVLADVRIVLKQQPRNLKELGAVLLGELAA